MPSVARYCCCGDCPASLAVTVVGMDAALCCSTTSTLGSPTGSIKYKDTAFDGDYSVPYDRFDVPDGLCVFVLSLPDIEIAFSDPGDVVCATEDTTAFVRSVELAVHFDKALQKVKLIRIDGSTTVISAGAETYHRAFVAESITANLGDVVSNQIAVCDSYSSGPLRINDLVPGGTIEVNASA